MILPTLSGLGFSGLGVRLPTIGTRSLTSQSGTCFLQGFLGIQTPKARILSRFRV